MNNKAPVIIITDQDKAMSNAIARVLPNTHHALCTWHISNKFLEKLHTLYDEYPTFKDDFNWRAYKSLTIDEFEGRWEKLMIDYELHDHDWLQSLYKMKHKWVKAYSKKYFAAGMTTTSRSEGMNSLFDDYVSATTSIKDFIVNLQKALKKQVIRERKADYTTCHRMRSMTLESPLETHGARIYTKEIFRRFQNEIVKSHSFIMQKIQHLTTPDTKSYAIYKANAGEYSNRYFTVVNNIQTGDINCTCQKFEHFGKLCRHILRYMIAKSTAKIPDKYIVSQWSRDGNKINAELPKILTELFNYEESQTMRYNYLVTLLLRLAFTGLCSIKGFRHVVQLCLNNQPIIEQFDPDDINVDAIVQIRGQNDEPDEDEPLLDPICSQTKGAKKLKE